MSPDLHNELCSLLNSLCEDCLSLTEKDRLEQLIIHEPEARRFYWAYIRLHGNLTWDAALSDSKSLVNYAQQLGATDSSVSVACTTATRPQPAPAQQGTVRRRTVRRHWSWPVAALSVALGIVLYFSSGNFPSGPSESDLTTPVVLDKTFSPSSIATHSSTDHSTATITEPADTSPIPVVDLHRTDLSHPVRGAPSSVTGQPATSPASIQPASVELIDEHVVTRINHIVAAQWAQAGVEPSPLADEAEWLRRIYLDVAGHIPDTATVDRYLSDAKPDKRSRIIDEVIQHPDYARHLSTIWMNLLVGRASDRPINRELLAKFLREQFRQNRPWTETVTRLIAAEGDANEVGETNFLLAHLNNQAVPATAVTTRIFLCQQVQCTQCHKHPDSKHGGSMAEFWELNSFFQQADIVENRKYNPATGRSEVVSRSLIEKNVGGPTYYDDLKGVMRVAYPKYAGQEVDPDPAVKRRQELARLLTDAGQRDLASALVNRTWAHYFGLGLVNPVDDMGPHSPCANPELLTTLTDAVIATGFDVERLHRWIVSSQAYGLSSEQIPGNRLDYPVDGELPLFSRMYVKPLSAEQLFDSLLVATAADRAGAHYWDDVEQQRRTWLAQFYSMLENEENCDASTFEGAFAQSLMLMNGDLVQNAISNAPGTVLHGILRQVNTDQDRIQHLCRAALGRDPKRSELAAFQPALRRRGDSSRPESPSESAPFEDIFWVYLNSTEFTINH